MKGEKVNLSEKVDKVKNCFRKMFSSAADGLKGPKIPKEGSAFDDETPEARELKSDSEFDPNAVLNTGKKQNRPRREEDNDFDQDIKVDFDRDDEDNPTHELKDFNKKSAAKSNMYGTL